MAFSRTSARPIGAAVLLLSLLLAAAPAHAEPPVARVDVLDLDRGTSGLALALRRVGSSGRVLYVTAHPDDEHNGVLVRLSRGLGLRTGLLTLTRGEGGQNAIGGELFAALGVLRTAELDSLHRFDAVLQYFGRAYEFGFSFSVEETLERWGHEETLGDVVRVVRAFRPDVILTLPLEGTGGGQHHQAAGRLAREAFRAAADPARFPGQLAEGLRPWQARKIYTGGVGGFGESSPGRPVRVPTGVYDPILGMTWQQLGIRSRAMHRCQGTPQLSADPGDADGVFTLLDAVPAVSATETDILDGVDTTLTGFERLAPSSAGLGPALAALQAKAVAARAAYDPARPEAAVPALVEALAALRAVEGGLAAWVSDAAAQAEIAERLAEEAADVEAALVLAQGLVAEARADDGLVTAGQTFGVAVRLWNASGSPLALEAVELEAPPGWTVARKAGEAGELPARQARELRFAVTVAPDARVTQPYWRRQPDRDRQELLVPVDPTLPFAPPDLVARVRCVIGGARTTLRLPATWRYEGPLVGGEKRHAVAVVPALSVRTSPEILPLPLAGPRRPLEVRAFVRRFSAGATEATLRLEAPAGWRVTPASVRLRLALEGEEASARFALVPPERPAAGAFVLRAVAESGGREFRDGVQAIEYPHVLRNQRLQPAEARVVALDVRTRPGAEVGYVAGSGDAIGDAVRELGIATTLLSPDDLAFADLSRFTTIVLGIRAYETRSDLRAAHGRLLRWVEAGGHLVVQYNRAGFNRPAASDPADAPSPFAPYPAVVTSERVTDETAPLRVLAPEHPLLRTPNRIGKEDWSGWVQERAIQLLAPRDPRYLDLLAAADPFPYNAGEKRGLLVEARVGRGTWTYVGLVLFREVPAGVPGAWRLLANLVSRPAGPATRPPAAR